MHSDYHGHELEMVDEHVSEEASEYAELESNSGLRSTRVRREPDRYGDMDVYWHNKGNQGTEGMKRGNFEGEGEL